MNILMSLVLVSSSLMQALPVQSSTEPLVHERVVNAPVAAVWEAFTTRAGIESWMTSTGDIDLRLGGLMRTSYRTAADLDGDSAIHQVILSTDPYHMLSLRTVKAPKDFSFPTAILRTWTVVYFDRLDDSRTRVIFKMFGYTSDDESQKMRGFFDMGNKTTMDRLVKKFER